MDTINAVIKAVVVLACVESVCVLLVPKGEFKKYVRFLGGVLAFAVLSEMLLALL